MSLKNPLLAISPIDGRYHKELEDLSFYASEFGLIRLRLEVEVEWLIHLSNKKEITELPSFDNQTLTFLKNIYLNFTLEDAEEVKNIEKETNHDVKAVEYFLQNKIKKLPNFQSIEPFIHFSCTSEDINNLAYALMIQRLLKEIVIPKLNDLQKTLNKIIDSCLDQDDAMLSRTHGQPASTTTMSKELTNFLARLNRQINQLTQQPILGKINGAVGNFNAHAIAYPNINWIEFSKNFIEDSLHLTWNPYTIQIEPHDNISEIFHNLIRINQILLDFSRDIWGYIAFEYFIQEKKSSEIGSSTMPHKINPINFENAEGNLGLSSQMLNHFSEKLTISRFQRDLSDSTVLRNIGTSFSFQILAINNLIKGLNKLKLNPEKLKLDLSNQWAILGEAIQTIMRKEKIPNAYEIIKEQTRGKPINKDLYMQIIESLPINESEKKKLYELTPSTYIGYAEELAIKRKEFLK